MTLLRVGKEREGKKKKREGIGLGLGLCACFIVNGGIMDSRMIAWDQIKRSTKKCMMKN